MNIFKQKVLHALWLLPFLFLLTPSGAFAQTASSISVTVKATSANGAYSCYNAGSNSTSCSTFISWKSGFYGGSGSATATFTTSGGATQTATCSGNAGGNGSSSCASPWVSVGGYSCRVHFLGIAAIPMDQASGSVNGSAICNTPSGTISASPNPCTISAGASTCTSAISWSTTNTPSATVTIGSQTFGTGTSNPGQNASIPHGSELFTLNDSNGNPINSVTVTGQCVSGTTWNGTGCASVYDSPSCTSSSGAALYTATPVKITSGPYSALNTNTINGYTTSRWNAVGSYSATISFNGSTQTFTDYCTRTNSIDGIGVADACDHSTTVSVGGGTFSIASSLTSPVNGDWPAPPYTAPYGGTGSVYGISCPPPPPPTVSFTASPNPVAYNGRSTLTWSSSGATSCTAGGPWSNSGTLSGSGLTNPLTSNTTFTFQCTGPGGTSPLQSVTVGVNPLNGTCGSANGVAYPYGSSSYSPYTQCSSGTSNNTAFPTQGTSVSWTCVGANGGSNSPACSASQNVHPNPSISLSPTNTTITLGQSVNYTVSSSDVVPDMTMDTVNWIAPGQSQWNWQNSSYGATVTPGNGYYSFPATNAETNTFSFTPTLAGTYTILAGVLDNNGTRWTTTPNYTLTVNNVAVTATLTASPNPVAYNGRSTLTWSSSGATSCTAGGPWSNSGTLSGSGLTNPLTSNTTFTFQCTGPGGTSPLQSVTVGVGSAAPCSATTISQCSLPATASGSTAGTCSSGTTGSCNYTCTNGSWSLPANSNSCVASPAPTITFSASPSTINSGQSSALSWSSKNATSCTSAGGFSTGGLTSGTRSTGALSTTSSYQITCTGPGGSSSANTTVTVIQPTATISAVPTRVHPVPPGNTVNLTWSSSGVTACTVTGTNGFFRNATSGTNVPSGAINSQTTFTITCNPGTVTDQVTVNVVPAFQEF